MMIPRRWGDGGLEDNGARGRGDGSPLVAGIHGVPVPGEELTLRSCTVGPSSGPMLNGLVRIAPSVQQDCPVCRHEEAVFFQSQQRSAETGMVSCLCPAMLLACANGPPRNWFYVCCYCGNIFPIVLVFVGERARVVARRRHEDRRRWFQDGSGKANWGK